MGDDFIKPERNGVEGQEKQTTKKQEEKCPQNSRNQTNKISFQSWNKSCRFLFFFSLGADFS